MAATHTNTIDFPKEERNRTPDFPAFGKTEGDVGHLKGVLKNNQGTIVATGNTLKDGSHWVIVFEGVPVGEYTLEVRGVGVINPATSNFRVESGGSIGGRLIGINPSSGAMLGKSFVAAGTSDQPYPVSGQIINPSGVYFGTTLQGPPGASAWYVQFNGVPAGTGYTLTVSDTEGNAVQAANLTVSGPVPMPTTQSASPRRTLRERTTASHA